MVFVHCNSLINCGLKDWIVMVLLSVIVESLHISEKKILLSTNCSICFKLAEMLPIQPKNKSHEQNDPYKK